MSGQSGLQQICALLNLEPDAGELVQRSVNHTYRFRQAQLMLRLSSDSPQVDHLVRVATELERLDVPAIRLAPGRQQAVRAEGWAATAWRLLPPPPSAPRSPVSGLPAARSAWRCGGDGVGPSAQDRVSR